MDRRAFAFKSREIFTEEDIFVTSEWRDIEEQWLRHNASHWTGRNFMYSHDGDIPAMIVSLDRLVHDIASSRGDQFKVVANNRGVSRVKPTELGRRIIESAKKFHPEMARQSLPRHKFSPYFELWERYPDEVQELALIGAPSLGLASNVNRWVDAVRAQALDSSFREHVLRQERAARKNWDSFRRYLEALFHRYSRLLVVRVDLGYRNDPVDFGYNWIPPSDAEVKASLVQMVKFIRRKLPSLIGYAWKIEFGARKGHHCHLMLIFNGHVSREGITMGRLAGEQWETITGGWGSYWNCNANMEDYIRRGLLGIGLINYYDKELRTGLMRTAKYLAKVDYYAKYVSQEIARTFGKGVIKGDPSTRGRPREYVESSYVESS